MSDPFLIDFEGETYKWAPAKSTPSVSNAVAELPTIIQMLRSHDCRIVVDFGCGRGRNVGLLSESFDEVIMVEDEANLPCLLKSQAHFDKKRNCTVVSWDNYKSRRAPKVDAVLICCVLHTIPADSLRLEVIEVNRRRLKKDGLMIIVSPKNDSKYTLNSLIDAIVFGKGIVRLYDQSKTFSFYQTLSRRYLEQLLGSVGLHSTETIASSARHILVMTATNIAGKQ